MHLIYFRSNLHQYLYDSRNFHLKKKKFVKHLLRQVVESIQLQNVTAFYGSYLKIKFSLEIVYLNLKHQLFLECTIKQYKTAIRLSQVNILNYFLFIVDLQFTVRRAYLSNVRFYEKI